MSMMVAATGATAAWSSGALLLALAATGMVSALGWQRLPRWARGLAAVAVVLLLSLLLARFAV